MRLFFLGFILHTNTQSSETGTRFVVVVVVVVVVVYIKKKIKKIPPSLQQIGKKRKGALLVDELEGRDHDLDALVLDLLEPVPGVPLDGTELLATGAVAAKADHDDVADPSVVACAGLPAEVVAEADLSAEAAAPNVEAVVDDGAVLRHAVREQLRRAAQPAAVPAHNAAQRIPYIARLTAARLAFPNLPAFPCLSTPVASEHFHG